jgi:hypothetical protein
MRLALLVASLLVLSCPVTEPPALPPGPDDPTKNLAQLDAFADRVQREALSAAWTLATEPGSEARPAPFGVLPLLLLRDREVRALDRRLEDPRQSQCLQAIHSVAVRMQSESDHRVASALTRVASLREQLPDLSRVFTDEEDGTRRKELWSSQARIAKQLEPLLLELIAARRQWALQRSRSGYLDLMREHRGYHSKVVEGLEASVRRALASRAVPQNRPWEFEAFDPRLAARMAATFDEGHCLQRASVVFHYLGLPANPAGLTMAKAKQTAFSSFAFYPIDPPVDQRLTVRPGAGIVPHWSAFHEFGHAAMALLVEPGSCRTFKRPVSSAVSESCAKIAERLFYSEEWLQTQGVAQNDIEAIRKWERQSEQMRMRSILADLEFERILYDRPDADLTARYMAIQRETAGVQADGDFPAWALKRHLAFEPLARADYLLARCGQAAVYRRLRKLPGGLMGEAARKVLREEVFRGASGLRFEEWFRRAAGTEPNCSAWLEDVAGAGQADEAGGPDGLDFAKSTGDGGSDRSLRLLRAGQPASGSRKR